MILHVGEVQVDVRSRELNVKRGNLLPQEEQVADGEELSIQRAGALADLKGSQG